MPEFLPPELIELRDRTAALAMGTLVPLRDDPGLGAAERAEAVRRASQEAGLYGLTQPAALGGSEASALAMVVVRDTLGRFDVGHLRGLFGAGPGLLADAGGPLRDAYLLPLLAGEKRAGFAFTEPADAPRRTWAAVEGDELVVNGQKSYVTGGGDAQFLTALVDVEGQGPAIVVIDTDAAGVTLVRRFESIDGSHHAAFTFDDVRIPAWHLVGAAGEGMGRAMGKISEVRMEIAARCVGTMGWILDELAAHLQAPRPRGGRLGDHERVRLRLGEARITAYAARSMLYRTARLADAGENVVNEAMSCKVFAVEGAGALVDAAIQLVGGEALITGHALETAFRRLRPLRLAEGETDTLRVGVARGTLDLGRGRI